MTRLQVRAVVTATAVIVSLIACGLVLAASPEISEADAVRLAFQYTGVGDQKDITLTASRENIAADDNVPFLRLAGRPAWRVRLDNVRIVVRGPSGETYENPLIHRLDVFLDAGNGRLLKIISPFPPDAAPATQPTLAQREKRMRYERYDGLPPEIPGVNFMQALQSAQEGLGGATKAKQIEALYVLFRRTVPVEIAPIAECRDAPCPRWLVTLRYLPPIDPPLLLRRLDGKPAQYRTPPFEHWQHHVDPVTGKWLGAGTVP